MKRLTKTILLLCVMLACMFSASLVSHAAGSTPGQVKNLKATAGESAVTLKWKKVSKASGYNIYVLDPGTNALKKVAHTKSTSCKIQKLTNYTQYTFCVAAYRSSKSKTNEGKKSAYVKVTPTVTKPGVPKLMIQSCGNQKISMKWKKVKAASGYEVYQLNASTNKFELIGKTTALAVTVNNLTNNKNYQFKARAYRTVNGITVYSAYSDTITAKPIAVSGNAVSIPTMTYKAKVKSTVNADLASGSGKVTVKKGTKVTVTHRSSSRCTVRLSNGTQAYIKTSQLTFTGCIYESKKDLSSTAKENFVNYKGYHSNTKYLVWISLYKQHLYVFKGSQCNWKIFKSFKCSTGKAATPTPKGTYRLWKKAKFYPFDEDCYAKYASYFSGNAIHSWVYTYAYHKWYRDGSLGNPASHGCVRLGNKEIKWVYDNVPIGSTIIIY